MYVPLLAQHWYAFWELNTKTVKENIDIIFDKTSTYKTKTTKDICDIIVISKSIPNTSDIEQEVQNSFVGLMESCKRFMVPYTFKKVFQSLDVSLWMKNMSPSSRMGHWN